MNPCHAKKCPSYLEGHGFSWANILCRFGLTSQVWRSKGCLCSAIPSVSCLIGSKENIYVKLDLHILATVVIVYKIGKEESHPDFFCAFLLFTTSRASQRKDVAILH